VAPWTERLQGIFPFLKLLAIPLLMAQFRASGRQMWAAIAFIASATVLLIVSFAFTTPLLRSHGNYYGVPVKDYITQSGIMVLCIAGLADEILKALRERRQLYAAGLILLSCGFLFDIVFIASSRTSLLVLPILLLAVMKRHFGLRIIGSFALGLVLLSVAAWSVSPYLRARVAKLNHEVAEISAPQVQRGGRVELWRAAWKIVEQSPWYGHGTGSIPETFRRLPGQENEPPHWNPHNELLAKGIQFGFVGVVVLLAMWGAHVLVFWGGGQASAFGLIVVIQNILSSMFNSHLLDFTQLWLYVFGVGVFAGGSYFCRNSKEGVPKAQI
jgi:O-antigen ligase